MTNSSEIQVEVLSRKTIKPSSPTPSNLRQYKLSFLDQLAPNVYAPAIFFYSNSNAVESSVSSLAESLADCLSRFYPLAGRITELDDSVVDCNDEGAEFLQATASCDLYDVVRNPDMEVLYRFLPFEPYGNGITSYGRELFAVKFTTFNCGGIAIGVCISHKVADGASVGTLLNHWSATSRGSDESTVPSFDAASYFPPREYPKPKGNFVQNKVALVTKRFVFKNADINTLRKQVAAADSLMIKTPTRVETLSTFIWKRMISIIRSKPRPTRICALVHAVNLQQRIPMASKPLFGNIFRAVVARATTETETEHHELVAQMRKAIREIDGDYVKRLQDTKSGYKDPRQELFEEYAPEEVDFVTFTSWCTFPIYEVDFGWGKPCWACSPRLHLKNFVVLTSTKEGDGIEAWITLAEEDMHVFQHDPEVLSFVTPNAATSL